MPIHSIKLLYTFQLKEKINSKLVNLVCSGNQSLGDWSLGKLAVK